MKYEMKKDNTSLVVNVEGELDVRTSPEFEKALLPAMDNMTDVVLDLKDLNYLSSAGLRVFLKAARMMEGKGSMALTNVSEDVMEILEVTGFNRLFTIK